MSIILTEKRNSRSSTENPKSATLRYTLTGITSETMARAYCRAATVVIYRGLYRQDIRLDPTGLGIWNVETTYGPYVGKQPEAGDFRWTFDTTGGTMHITNAIASVARFPATATNFNGLIGVDGSSINGCDIGTDSRKWTETRQLNADSIGFDYGDIIEELTFTTNSASFRGKPAGYVLFMGATGGGSNKDPDIIELTFNFATGRVLTNKTISGITGISKKPWEYLWFRYKPETYDVDGVKEKIMVAKSAHVEQVFESGDFSLLGIGTGATPG
jgi:hypothetical protein